MNKILWLYWENLPGKQEYSHVSLCRKVIKHQCFDMDIRLVTPNNLSDYLPDIHPNIHKIKIKDQEGPCLAIKTGFIRAFLLRKYGGVYLDSDAIPLRSLSFVAEDVDKNGFVAMRRTSAPKKHISIGFMGARPNNIIINKYSEILEERLEENFEYGWGEIGARTLTPIVNVNSEHCHIYPEKDVHPIVAEDQRLLASKTLEPSSVLEDSSFIFMLYHRIFTGPMNADYELGFESSPDGWLGNYSEKKLYQSDMLISKMYRKAYPDCSGLLNS